jgi:hypothetical protein|tara:strand:- start:17705 stop:17995 length:291 start_codon:yes stop_codon:yes gene_type:complete
MARNYRSEYDNYHSTERQKKDRAARNTARNRMIAKGKVKKGDGMDVHHRDGNPRNNDPSNLKAVPKRLNRMVNKFEGGRLRGVGRAVQGVRPHRDT